MAVDKTKAINKGIPINKFVGLKSKMYSMNLKALCSITK